MIRRLLDNFRAVFLKNKPGTLSLEGDTQAPLVAEDTPDNSMQDSTPTSWWRTIVVTSLGVTVVILGVRGLGWLQRWELRAYDHMMALRPKEPIDNRIVLVTVTEEDLQRYNNPLPDETINKLLKKIKSYQPFVIGLHIKRPRQANLAADIGKEKIIASCAFGSMGEPEVPPPANFDGDNIAFRDFVFNRSNIIRRGLIFQKIKKNSRCNTDHSFAITLAINYLYNLEYDADKNKYFTIGNTVFKSLTKNSGGYVNLDNKGSQILINYRHPSRFARTVTLTNVLTDKFEPDLFEDRLVIIGITARSGSNRYQTPYHVSENNDASTVSPVVIHAQITSQLISAVLDNRPLIWYFPEWLEAIWTMAWSLVGGILAWKVRRPVFLLIVSGITVSGLVIICYGLIVQAGWVPVVPPGLALVFTSIGVLGYTSYQTQQQTKVILLEVEKQKDAIEQLNTLLNETSGIQDAPRIQPIAPTANISTASTNLLSNRYRVTRVLAQGGFGCTYLAKDTQRPGLPTCVVKQLMPARRDTRFLQVARRLFDSEAEILELLGKHHQIPELYAFFEEEKEFYLVQQFIPGHPLTDELPPHKNIKSEAEVTKMLKELLEVLAFIHQRQVIHRDIKPANIIRCNQDNRLVLIDFGAVKLMQPQSKEQTELATIAIGTRGYTPPEQFAGHPRLSSDIYALGMIAIQSLTGLLPHELQPNPYTGNVEWKEWAKVSNKLAAILDKMVRYHASERYKSAVEALEELSQC
ncbi:MAG: CHASE2 domain-containing serine/threonine-protein kinase [Cyanobacteria bacterium J06643_5]